MHVEPSQSPQDRHSNVAIAVAEHGFALVKELEASLSTEAVARAIGDVLTFGKSYATHKVVPQTSGNPNTYSGIYGLDPFPLHSDMAHWHVPPRYMLLRSMRGHNAVATQLLDGHVLVTTVGITCLTRAIVRPRRPFSGKLPLLALYRQRQRHSPSLLRWDEQFIVPASPAGIAGMTQLRNAIESASPMSITLAKPGDTLVIDNWRMDAGLFSIYVWCHCFEFASSCRQT
jgi:hypothetical protein